MPGEQTSPLLFTRRMNRKDTVVYLTEIVDNIGQWQHNHNGTYQE